MEKTIPTSVLFIDMNNEGGRNTDADGGGTEGVGREGAVVLFPNVWLSLSTMGGEKVEKVKLLPSVVSFATGTYNECNETPFHISHEHFISELPFEQQV